ncbi:MAG: hypothetical protein ACRDF0_07135 [Candidatus Limnocylindria bacterium]
MTDETRSLVDEAKALDLFQPQGAFEVHCSHCHARLDGMGDCATCGLIGRPAADLERRAETNAEAVTKLLTAAITKRKGYKPVGGKAERG